MNVLAYTQAPIVIAGRLSQAAERQWPTASKNVIWGWKRDSFHQSRSVYFSGELRRNDTSVVLDRYFFHYRSKIEGDASLLIGNLDSAQSRFAGRGDPTSLTIKKRDALTLLELSLGVPTAVDQDRVRRLKLRRPRRRIASPDLPPSAETVDRHELWPADLYLGSGISYEAGLPTLCDMHEIFCVDNEAGDAFTVGASDELPRFLATEGSDRLLKFCKVHSLALSAPPTAAMTAIARLHAAGKVRRIFTDNVDNMLSKTGVPYERVRGSGVFNERYPANFSSPRLIVVGVAADRRQIVRQSRAARMKTIVVNPCARVSPNVMHLDYLRAEDLFFKWEAKRFFAEALGKAQA